MRAEGGGEEDDRSGWTGSQRTKPISCFRKIEIGTKTDNKKQGDFN